MSRKRGGRAGPAVLLLTAIAAFALVAGCGGSPKPSVAGEKPTATASKSGNPAAYSACMRAHGVPNFPDPDSQGHLHVSGGSKNGKPFGVNPNTPQFKSAEQTCRSLEPEANPTMQAQAMAKALKFSQCMRSHGVPDFPDPKVGPGGGIELGMSGSIANSSQLAKAQQECRSLAPGGVGK
jgi:hypothetical protein